MAIGPVMLDVAGTALSAEDKSQTKSSVGGRGDSLCTQL